MSRRQPEYKMDFKANERLFSSKLFLYLSRILILYTFSVIFKSFDHTFSTGLRVMNLRGQLFSLIYVVFGLLVWEGATRLVGYIERKSVHKQPARKLLLLCCCLLIYGFIAAYVFGFLYAVSDILFFHRYEAWESFTSLSYDLNFGIFMFFVLIVTFNGIIYYYTAWKEYQVQAERLMRENIQAQYEALRNQIDPHFFFNSLSVLTNLVYKSPDISAHYITQLAKTYRFILDKKFENLVSVRTELDFLDAYLYLIRIRHQQSIIFEEQIDEEAKSGMIPPATLQLLIENAIRHNRFSTNEPLHIRVVSENGCIVVSNPVRKKAYPEISSGIGLENIRKRYALISNRQIDITETDQMFIVKAPIIEQT